MLDFKIAAAYIRVSTDDQVEYSPDAQLAEIRKYASTHSFILPEEFIFVDEGISGKNTGNHVPLMQFYFGNSHALPETVRIVLYISQC